MSVEILPNLAVLKISGADATDFLQGQLTNDIKLLNSTGVGNWQYSGYCNPKGRLLALFSIWRIKDDYFAIVTEDLVAQIVPRLKMFVMRSKVTIEQQSEAAFYGQHSLQSLGSDLDVIEFESLQHQQFLHKNNTTYLLVNQRLMIVSHTGVVDEIETLEINEWQRADIADGLPQVTAASSELFIPQMINLDIIGGISFDKGCYTGQEIVARMHYLGKLKQRMFLCTGLSGAKSDRPLVVGDRIFADPDRLKPVGTIVSYANSEAQTPSILAVLRLTAVDDALHLENGDLITINSEQPYSITAAQ